MRQKKSDRSILCIPFGQPNNCGYLTTQLPLNLLPA